MSEQQHNEIEASSLFGQLDAKQRERIERLITYHSYIGGQLFHSPYERGEQIFILQQGRVRLYKLSPEGRALTLAILEPVTMFGEMTLIGQHLHDSFAEAMTDCLIGTIRRDDLYQLVRTEPQVALSFINLIGQRLREIESKLADIAFKNVPQRLASVLINMADSARSEAPRVVRYTHQQLAEMIGSYRETVTKAIGEFREAGLIKIDDDTIHLTDVEELRRLAHK
ncbi:MAG: Crp/Fnr family transcriptional regulator [Chloroflexaceae bacterium]|nr:Crp/Fnr family transcriptional regulator [Chloroflexaceae bacterium]NJL33299.1 Crp/Fnr family transcriptional regulator [Chloroflexaceae bacterium]NJO04287.1 Crp/Fnr family transcriptional regulator [Chloroflexaceae bacterium]